MADSAARLRSAQSRPIPARIGRYEILLPIASGGMAVVYLARSRGARGFEREVALKLTHAHLSDETEFASLALDEARIAARIRHRNVVSILDVGEDPMGLFLVMEYVEGATFSQLLKAKPRIPIAIGVRILLDALSGLHAAHELCGDDGALLGVVHRDFSPQNILVGLDGVAQLTDFGIAKAADRAGHTATGVIKGKVAYMAPEQAIGVPVDRRADVWSAGVVAWELFAGHRLYPNGEGVATLLRLVQEPPPRLRTACPEVTTEIEEIVARALSRKPEDRPATAAAFARALGEACAAAGHVADHDAVAEFAKQFAGARLATRRVQAGEVLRLRGRMDALAEQSIEGAGTTGSMTSAGLPPAPPSPPRGETTLVESGTVTVPNDTASTENDAARWRPRRASLWALALGALAGIGLLATVLAGRTAGSRVEAPAAVAPMAVAASTGAAIAPPATDATLVGQPDAATPGAGRAGVTLERAPSERMVPKRAAAAASSHRSHGTLAPSPYNP